MMNFQSNGNYSDNIIVDVADVHDTCKILLQNKLIEYLLFFSRLSNGVSNIFLSFLLQISKITIEN